MTFDPIAVRSPQKPDRLQLILTVSQSPSGVRKYEGTYLFEIRDAPRDEDTPGDVLEARQGDAIPHYTPAERAQFAALLDKGLDKARTSVP